MKRADFIPHIHTPILKTWLPVLFWLHLLSLPLAFLSPLTDWQAVLTWVGRILSMVNAAALFLLAGASSRYLIAAILCCVNVVGGLLASLGQQTLLSAGVSLCALIADYQEYAGHGEICAEFDRTLADKWHRLFYWQLGIGILMGMLSSAGVVIGVLAGVETETIVTAAVWITAAVSAVVDALYLIYIRKMKASLPEPAPVEDL